MRDSTAAAGQHRGRTVLAWLVSVLRQVAGMPDYKGYAEHLGRYHPDTPVLTEREYYVEYLRRRYGDGPTRCC